METETTEETLQRQQFINCLTKQLEEIDLLLSIYCNPGEFKYNPSVISDFNEYINNKINSLSLKMDLSIFLTIPSDNIMENETDGASTSYKNDKYEIRIELPYLYPIFENANVTITSPSFTKYQENYLNKKILNFIENEIDDKSEPYIYLICSWINDNLTKLLESATKEHLLIAGNSKTKSISSSSSSFSTNSSTHTTNNVFERLWIYSHHIKSKIKRKNIVQTAKELQLTGFSLPGKPGIICVEGLQCDTQEFWRTIKSMRWQKIQIKLTENEQKTTSEDATTNFDINQYRRFSKFKEELFTNIGTQRNDDHDDGNDDDDDEDVNGVEEKMNMSLFMKYLELHNSGYIKKEIFGFD